MTSKRKTWTIAIVGVCFVLAAAVAYYVWQSGFIETDDAAVTANQVAVSAKFPGRLAQVAVRTGVHVNRGDLIAKLDTSEVSLQVNAAEASYHSLEARFHALAEGARDTEIAAAEAARQEAETALDFAKKELDHNKQLFKMGAVSNDALERSQTAKDTAQARLDRAENQLALVRGGLKKADLRAAAFEADRALAQLNLLKTQLAAATITSPVTGMVANQLMHAGEYVQPGQTIVYVTDESDVWITAYLEEGKLAPITVGMPADIHLDAQDRDVTGKVRMIGNTAASVFSLFPPDRAAGNYTKVSQRVPIEISVAPGGGYVPGSSAVVKFLLR